MTAADISGAGDGRARDNATPAWPGLAAAGVLLAGVYAVIRFREGRRNPAKHRAEIPDALREDVGLPPRQRDRGWWEWR
jgi:hypothetical protein